MTRASQIALTQNAHHRAVMMRAREHRANLSLMCAAHRAMTRESHFSKRTLARHGIFE
jgi:hypothetical protein